MIRRNIYLIAALGERGQIGLNGALPWGRDKGDLPWFRAETFNNVVIFGARTAAGVGPLPNRTVAVWRGQQPEGFLDALQSEHKNQIIYIAGGSYTYQVFAPFVSKWLISRIDYDGPADTYFPFAPPWWHNTDRCGNLIK